MKIYTRTGDKGKTSIIGGKRLSKADPIIATIGSIDELNSFIGLARSHSDNSILKQVQIDLFKAGTEVAGGKAEIGETDVKRMEEEIDSIKLPELKSFLLPSGKSGAAILHICRSICRRTERHLVKTSARPTLAAYFNRLSDLLFVLARLENKKTDFTEEFTR